MSADYQTSVSLFPDTIFDTGSVDITYGVVAQDDSDPDTDVVVTLNSDQYGILETFTIPLLNPGDSFSQTFQLVFLNFDVRFPNGTTKSLTGSVSASGDTGSDSGEAIWGVTVFGTLGRTHRDRSSAR